MRAKRDKTLPQPLCLTPFPGDSGLVLPPCPQQEPVPPVWDIPGGSLYDNGSSAAPHHFPFPTVTLFPLTLSTLCKWPLALGKLLPSLTPLKGCWGPRV